MHDNGVIEMTARQLGVGVRQVSAVLSLTDGGATVPFIARYRKEATSGLNEVDIENIRSSAARLRELEKRKTKVLETIEELGKLTPELRRQIVSCYDTQLLEDLYLPYKPKRKTRASQARELGLEPLATWLLKQYPSDVNSEARRYLKAGVADTSAALQGARDIIAEIINEDLESRSVIRQLFQRTALIETKVTKGKEQEAVKYKDYYHYKEPLAKCPSHRVLAIFRGENEDLLKLSIEPDDESAIQKLCHVWIKKRTESGQQIESAIRDGYKRLMCPSIETEFKALAKASADKEAIRVFAENLRQLLLSAPLGNKRILALDPGFRSGCKVVCLNEEGKLIADTVIYPHEPLNEIQKATSVIHDLIHQFKIEAIAIGNGTAGRETETFVKKCIGSSSVEVFMVNESGASIYSASEIARLEFPDKDITVRGAVSIGRRLADPLAELVKIDPKSIGVGQYQYDVNQQQLKDALDAVVLSCVSRVGVNINTASKSLLTYVSGLGPQIAENIIEYRNKNGAFKSRSTLKKIPRLGEKAFEQCAGFLRISNAQNPLDNSAVHPESYYIAEQMAKDIKVTVVDLMQNENLRKKIDPGKYVTEKVGLPTINDILNELAKPGRDPRENLETFSFADVKSPEDLHPGMVLPGIVTNITNFGCFVDVGVKQDGMVHISQLADRFVRDPNEVVKLQQHVQVKVMEVDISRKRISLSMKEV